MEVLMGNTEENNEIEEFKPKGAVAFFVVLLVFFTIIWFMMYFELLSRG
jgi:hypothetical protein